MLSYNSLRTLDKSLNMVKDALSEFDGDSEVIVIENGSTDGSVDVLKELVSKNPNLIVPIFSDKNLGTTVSRNKALAHSTGEYVLVLDSDAFIDHECLNKLKLVLDTSPNVGLVCPKVFYGDGRFQLSTDQFPTLKRKLQRFFGLNEIQSKINHKELKSEYVDYAISACWLLRRNAVDAVGGFDERIFYAPEDVDYCITLWKTGFEIKFEPDAEMIHDAQELSRGGKINKYHVYHLLGLFYLFLKHRYVFSLNKYSLRR